MQAVTLNTVNFQDFTHRYHCYPAKFYPPLVRFLIANFADPKYPIADLFAGCGTTLLESKLAGIKSIGVDINPITKVITDAKLNPIVPKVLENKYNALQSQISKFKTQKYLKKNKWETIDILSFWFNSKNLDKAIYLKKEIKKIKNSKIQNFFLCALSNCLKKASIASSSSPKLTRNKNKNSKDLFHLFDLQVAKMISKNKLLYSKLKKENKLYLKSQFHHKDARKSGILSNSVGTIITSPPYAASYEYENLHKLSNSIFFPNQKDQEYIGSYKIKAKKIRKNKSALAYETINNLEKINYKKSQALKNYFNQMWQVLREAKRILVKNGKLILVISDSTICNQKVPTTQIFCEMLNLLDFKIDKMLVHKLDKKQIPFNRDDEGKFTKKSKKQIYKEEFIIVAYK